MKKPLSPYDRFARAAFEFCKRNNISRAAALVTRKSPGNVAAASAFKEAKRAERAACLELLAAASAVDSILKARPPSSADQETTPP